MTTLPGGRGAIDVVINDASTGAAIGSGNLAVNAQGVSGAPISVPTSATKLAAARPGRTEVTLIFETAVQARIGGSNVTSTAYGALYGGVAQEAITISGGAEVWGFGVGGTATISVIEVY